MQKESHVNGKYKDRLFNFIFGNEENREWTLSLYNAINGSNYDDASQIRFNTLENVLYIGMKNDTSFLISGTLKVYEHQSTYNTNMPIRFLDYVSELFTAYINENKYNLYGSALISLPTPKLVVFYNGIDEQPEESILKLSDSFMNSFIGDPDVEIKVRMLNINYGRNHDIMKACKPLCDYSWFISSIRKYQKMDYRISEAVEKTLAEAPKDFVLKSFLEKNKWEVEGMLDTEYNEEKIRELFMEDGRREERANTEREKARADAAEAESKKLKAELDKLRAQISVN